LQVWFDPRLRRLRIRFRKKGHKTVTLPGPLLSPEFMTAYQAALGDEPMPAMQLPPPPPLIAPFVARPPTPAIKYVYIIGERL
jgi:hypothetical protein